MDASLYKDTATSRGLTYHYYFWPPQQSRPTLLFCHGFPSTSWDWRHLAPRMKDKGYGVLAPDMLGYGGTDKPTDPAAYVPSLMTRDIVDVLDAEKLDKVIAVGHDWGCLLVSRLASHFPERFLGYTFLAVPFLPVVPPEDFHALLERQRVEYGHEKCGYWLFFSEPDVDAIIQAHIDSFVSLLYPRDHTVWKTHIMPVGALKNGLLQRFSAPPTPYISDDDRQRFVETFRRNGFAAPTCWYKVMTSQLSAKDDLQIPPERMFPPASSPIFFAAARDDHVCPPESGHAMFNHEVFSRHSITTKQYDADHWCILSHAVHIANDLDAWIQSTQPSQAVIPPALL
ncbi:alpha/beta-hydrolase [Phanerochaete sordida]|uniref:Alpha/beta-hydrolase n=1 Tax=Phanerochaete sordida TaxID=48140 RepID=A0A9P3FWU4_9APHY|nr:alpha/beta-hydrolase [Phanerochaete sordida]